MEPFTTAALAAALTALVSGAAGEAGKTSWVALKSAVTARFGRGSQQVDAVAALEAAPADPQAAEYLATVLEDTGRTDPAAAQWLVPWLEQARTASNTNQIAGQAQVEKAIQIQNNQGNITM